MTEAIPAQTSPGSTRSESGAEEPGHTDDQWLLEQGYGISGDERRIGKCWNAAAHVIPVKGAT